MTRFRFQLIKHKDLLLFFTCFLSHAVFAPIFYYFGFKTICWYSVGSSFFYGAFILFYIDLPRNFFFTFSYLEILFYSVFITIFIGADSGTELFTVTIIPALFLFNFSSYKDKVYSIILSLLAFAATFFIVWWDFIRPGAISDGFLTAVSINRLFYIIHYSYCTFTTTIFLLYLSITVSLELTHSKQRTYQHALQLEYIANHDPLTGLLNRRKIATYFTNCENQKAAEKTDYALTIFDIDNFKHVNDTYGHDVGDYILCQTTSFIKSMLQTSTPFARWGGEEFLILFTSYSKTIIAELNSIRKKVEKHSFKWKKEVIPITLTFGLASSVSCTDINNVIIAADNNLMYGKQHGKNCVVTLNRF